MIADGERQSLEAALAESEEHDGSMFLTGALDAAFSYSPGHRRELRDFRLKDQTELDLHLAGANVFDHETRADWLGVFMNRTAQAVKELAKGIAGKERHTPGLLVEGPGAGSVRVIFRSPPQPKRAAPVPGTDVETLDGKALHQFASLFMLAEDETDLLEASVHQLPGGARRALRQVGQSVVEASWSIEGSLTARGRDVQPVVISPTGAARLVHAVGEQAAETESKLIAGAVDGWTWSKSVMDFQPSTGRGFRAVVPPDLQESVAAINGQPDHDAVGRFRITTIYPSGDYSYQRRSYVLEGIEAAMDSDLLDLL
ncbi:hypothetical protein [Nocardioides sp. Leaf307]|uniref:hypothetical protein n=1 Tax=Nocardioides sp. Leaf307 TaxID=1736331 RepID=UPI000702AD7E|nr:hypothetical protein [Nocardioides sp. Leaf307]KQQ43079.1 hypothetical protein ASF50_03535 [Nocardioides sp. Leaf307]